MKPPKMTDPHPEIAAPILNKSLEMQISFAEKAVIERDARIRKHFGELTDRVRTKPRRFVRQKLGLFAGIAAVGIALAGFEWWRHRKTSTPSRAKPEAGQTRDEGWSLMAFLPTLWRMLPNVVKEPVTKAVTGEVHHFAALFARFVRRKATQTHGETSAPPADPAAMDRY